MSRNIDDSKKLSFAIKDTLLGEGVSPSNLTLPMLGEFLEQVTLFLRGKSRKDLGEVKTSIEEGSLAVVVEDNTGLLNDAFIDYESLRKFNSLETIDPIRASVVEQWQDLARKNDSRTYVLYEGDIKQNVPALIISHDTNFRTRSEVWVDVDLYLYGKIYDLGGKSKPNVHIELENGNSIKIGAHSLILENDKENRLYKEQLVRIKAKQNIATQELKDEQLVSFEHYSPAFNEDEFEKIVKKAKIAWQSIKSPTDWVENLRGNNA